MHVGNREAKLRSRFIFRDLHMACTVVRIQEKSTAQMGVYLVKAKFFRRLSDGLAAFSARSGTFVCFEPACGNPAVFLFVSARERGGDWSLSLEDRDSWICRRTGCKSVNTRTCVLVHNFSHNSLVSPFPRTSFRKRPGSS